MIDDAFNIHALRAIARRQMSNSVFVMLIRQTEACQYALPPRPCPPFRVLAFFVVVDPRPGAKMQDIRRTCLMRRVPSISSEHAAHDCHFCIIDISYSTETFCLSAPPLALLLLWDITAVQLTRLAMAIYT